MTPADPPFLPRGVRLHQDLVRGVPVLLGPETALMLDPVGQAVLAEVDELKRQLRRLRDPDALATMSGDDRPVGFRR